MSHCVYSWQGIVAFVIAAILYLFLWETWSKAYEEDLEEETIEYYMIYTVWSKPESYGSRVILATADEAEARFRFPSDPGRCRKYIFPVRRSRNIETESVSPKEMQNCIM